MPRIYWMEPGQTMFVSGLIRIDLLEVNNYFKVINNQKYLRNSFAEYK